MVSKLKRVKTRMFKGLRVVDATTSQKFKVITEDGGTPSDPADCRAARALGRAFPGATVAVYEGVTLIEEEAGTITRYRNSSAMRKVIKTFDANIGFPPGVYVLQPVPAGRTLAARSAENAANYVARKDRDRNKTGSGLPNGKPPVITGRGRPHYDVVAAK